MSDNGWQSKSFKPAWGKEPVLQGQADVQYKRYKSCGDVLTKITRKRGICECIATWGRPTPHKSFSALIMMPCQVWSRSTYPLPYYSICAADTLRCDLDLWPWTFVVYRLWRDETLYQIWTQSSYPRRSYCDFRSGCSRHGGPSSYLGPAYLG